MPRKKKSWERQKDEPMVWYTRFRLYLDQGPARNIARTLRLMAANDLQLRDRQSGKVTTPKNHQLRQIAKDWRWKERAEAYDEHRLAEDDQWVEEQRQRRRKALSLLFEKIEEQAEHVDLVTLRSFALAVRAYLKSSREEEGVIAADPADRELRPIERMKETMAAAAAESANEPMPVTARDEAERAEIMQTLSLIRNNHEPGRSINRLSQHGGANGRN